MSRNKTFVFLALLVLSTTIVVGGTFTETLPETVATAQPTESLADLFFKTLPVILVALGLMVTNGKSSQKQN